MQSSKYLVTRFKPVRRGCDVSFRTLSLPVALPRALFHALASRASQSVTGQGPWEASSRQDEIIHDPKIDLRSLKNTVEAHREANLDGLVRKVDQGGTSSTLDTGRPLPGDYAPNLNVPRLETTKGLHSDLQTLGPAFKTPDLPKEIGRKPERAGRCATWTAEWRPERRGLQRQARMPWIRNLSGADHSAWATAADQLTAEISAFAEYISPDSDEKLAASLVIDDIREAIRSIDDSLEIDVIGSRATGIADALSDIDINVTVPPSQLSTPVSPSSILGKLERGLRRRGHPSGSSFHRFSPFQVLVHIKHAKVPILICRHRPSMLEVQIQSSPRAWDSTEYVKAFLKEYPSLGNLYKVIKQALLMRGLTQGVNGGLTSYPLLNMIVASLKFSELKRDTSDSGNHFLDFLDLYSELDFSKTGISTRPLELFPKSRKKSRSGESKLDGNTKHRDATDNLGSSPFDVEVAAREQFVALSEDEYKMILQDPANPSNDLGKGAWRIRDIQATLIHHRYYIRESVARWKQPTPEDTYRRYLLLPSLAANYTIHEQERSELKSFAASVKETDPRQPM